MHEMDAHTVRFVGDRDPEYDFIFRKELSRTALF